MAKSNNPVGRPIDRSRDEMIAGAIRRGMCMRHILTAYEVGYYAVKRVEREQGLRLKVSPYMNKPGVKRPKAEKLTLVGNEYGRMLHGVRIGLSNW